MRIGIDARALSDSLTGLGRYTFEISKKMLEMPGSRLYFFSPSFVDDQIVDGLQPSVFKMGRATNRFSKIIDSQVKFPWWAKQFNVDVFWGGVHRIPFLLPTSIARVLTVHDLVFKHAPQTMRPLSLIVENFLLPKAIAMADLVVADSYSTASDIAWAFPQLAHKVRVVQLGVSGLPSLPESGSLAKFNIIKPYCLFVGTLEPRKNLDRLLKAFASIPEIYRNQFSLVIAGGKGWGNFNLKKVINEYRLNDSVKLLGYVTDCDLSALYANARFLVMPSIYEGFGLPLLEAMQYGTPVLTSYEGSLAEVAGTGGILVDPFSVQSISLGIQQMLADDSLIKTLGNLARHRASEFSWEKCAAETMAVFEEAMALRDIRMSHS